jgi:hypothetical protein
MTLTTPPAAVAGNYTMAVDVVGPCATTNVPADLQHRKYDAVITQDGVAMEITLTEPRFRVNGQGRGNLFSGHAQFGGFFVEVEEFNSYYYPIYSDHAYPSVVEQLSDGTYLVPHARVLVSSTGSGLSGQTTNGSLLHWGKNFPSASAALVGGCLANTTTIQVTFTPR